MTSTQKIIAAVLALAAVGGIIAVATGGDAPKTPDAAAPEASYVKTDPPITSGARPNAAAPSGTAMVEPGPGPTSVNLATAAHEAKMVSRAQAAIDQGDYRTALREIEDYEKIPNRELLTVQATLIKINALSHVGRRTDALALAMETRTDDKFKDHRQEVEAVLLDAGLAGKVSGSP